jgi:D-aminopeptidase
LDAFDRILILADIEGSSGCWQRRDAAFLNPHWARACLAMTRDIAAVVDALLRAGVRHIVVKDFHGSGYNLLPEWIDPRAAVVSGYRSGPVPGVGSVDGIQAALFIGLHAAAGTDGFLAHTLSSRLRRLEVNGRPLPEVELFAGALAPDGVKPLFFSGDPLACRQAVGAMPALSTYTLEKNSHRHKFDPEKWRIGLARAAVAALAAPTAAPYRPAGPFDAQVEIRGGVPAAAKLARRWQLARRGACIRIEAPDLAALYLQLVRLCYLTPTVEKLLPLTLRLFNLRGRLGLAWVRRRLRAEGRL